jgi:hypothetical protein
VSFASSKGSSNQAFTVERYTSLDHGSKSLHDFE